MRRTWMLAGAALAVAGLLLADLPLADQSVGPVFVPSVTAEYVFIYQAPLDLLFPRVEFAIGWTATADQTNLSVVSCGGDAACRAPASAPIAVGHGLFGNLSFAGAANTYYEVLPTGGGVNVTVRYATPLLGGALGFGALLAGIVLGSLSLTGPRRRRPEREEDADDLDVSDDEEPAPARRAGRLRRR